MKNINKILIAALALTFFSCDNEFENPVEEFQVTSGEANFTKYVALGNSLTSGYMDNALYVTGQENSYPNILAQLMSAAGGGTFAQPLMPDDIGGFSNFGVAGKLQLQVVNGSLSPVETPAQSPFTPYTGAINNFGVPGAKSFHLAAAGYGNPAGIATGMANPYYARFASSATSTVIGDAVAQQPTFFSLWIGNNDVLSYATSGGTGVNQTGNVNPTTYGPNDITDPNVLGSVIDGYVKALTANGAKGVIANIPSVTSVPFFTTVPSKPLANLSDAQITALTAGYAAYNGGLAQAKAAGLITDAEYQARLIKFTAGAANGVVFVDDHLTDLAALGLPSYRQTTSKDLILLTTLGKIQTGGGSQVPLADGDVLSEAELAEVETATGAYNAKISAIATKYNLALVDANTEMRKISNVGLTFYGTTFTTSFIQGGAFSLDGVHPTGIGYAIVANMFVDAINKKYRSTLRKVNPNDYPGVKIP
ncbi:SGNH/GDSL hydrolase family protein [Vaginella massiliensis]|uniref:SGNH/GDSL hydrolase family protein n=1 Tax=Vaginella massiliensis TaxID=1816680 RepID=UPI000A788889|nr:SGNH/GDSL hydrolase family protein [Vaginella massiliensis]